MLNADFNSKLNAGSARQDKIEIELSGRSVIGDVEDIRAFCHRLGAPPREERDVDLDFVFGRIFSCKQGKSDWRHKLAVRGRKTNIRGAIIWPPLFGGGLEISRVANSWPMTLKLFINPTRILRYQEPWPEWNLPGMKLNLMSREMVLSDEFSLTGQDNWMPSPQPSPFKNELMWHAYVARCLREVSELVEAEFRRAAELSQSILTGSWTMNLLNVENYWEYPHPSPTALVYDLIPVLDSFSAYGVRIREMPAIEGNSACVSARLRSGEDLKIYPKTNKRIRIEVTHRFRDEKNPFPQPHTFGSIRQTHGLIYEMSKEAAKAINEFLQHYRLTCVLPENQHSSLKLIADIQSACGIDSSKSYLLLELLIANGFLRSGKNGDLSEKYRVEIAALKRKKVLRSTRGCYVVTSEYVEALRHLNECGLIKILSRQTRRKPRRVS